MLNSQKTFETDFAELHGVPSCTNNEGFYSVSNEVIKCIRTVFITFLY